MQTGQTFKLIHINTHILTHLYTNFINAIQEMRITGHLLRLNKQIQRQNTLNSNNKIKNSDEKRIKYMFKYFFF